VFTRARTIPRPYVTLRDKLNFMVRSCYTLAQPPKWRTTNCRLSVTTYSTHSQVPSISVGCLPHSQPEDTPSRGGRGPHNLDNITPKQITAQKPSEKGSMEDHRRDSTKPYSPYSLILSLWIKHVNFEPNTSELIWFLEKRQFIK